MLKQQQYTEKRTIAPPEIDFEHGRPDVRATSLRMAWAFVLVIIAAGAAGILGWVAPSQQSTAAIFLASALAVGAATMRDWSLLRGALTVLAFAAGMVALSGDGYGLEWGQLVAGAMLGLVASACLGEAHRTFQRLRDDEEAYREYLAERRASHLQALAEHAGQNIERQLTNTEIDLGRFDGIIKLVVYAKLMNRSTISDFTGPLLLQGQGRHISLGTASRYTAELATAELERIGVLMNRGEGRAREVREEPLEELIWRAAERWGKA